MAEGDKTNSDTQDLSMEDILKTIRGVIAGDDTVAGSTNAAASPSSTANAGSNPAKNATTPNNSASNDEILELTQVVKEEETSNDIIKNIDAALATTNSKTAAPAMPATVTDKAKEEITTKLENPKIEEKIAEIAAVVEDAPTKAVAKPADKVVEKVTEKKVEKMDEAVNKPTTTNIDNEALQKNTKNKDAERLISEQSAEISTEAISTLLESIPKPKNHSPILRSGTTLEDLVIEAIKPYLATWLDENLPTIVKQLVEKEIKKLIPREND